MQQATQHQPFIVVIQHQLSDASDLLAPEAGILTRLGRVDRAPVPEAAVDKDGEAELGENEIGFAEERMIATPADDPKGADNLRRAQFGGVAFP